MPETWDAITVGSNSLNHCMLGHVMEWFHGWVLGIRQDEGSIGWQEILIAPEVGNLEFAQGYLDSPQGRIDVKWTNKAGYNLDVVVPKDVRAKAVLPHGDHFSVDGKPVQTKSMNGKPYVELSPGRHQISARPWVPCRVRRVGGKSSN
jgi:hypothetical protein